MLDAVMDTIFNGLILGTSGYAMCMIKPAEQPFAFSACVVGFCHGCVGLYTRFVGNSCSSEGKCTNSMKRLTTSCVEIISVPLVNMDLYHCSQQSSALALGHGLFIIPLAFDLSLKLFSADGDEGESTAVLIDLTVLGNIVSLLFLAINESNTPAGLMALSAFIGFSGSLLMEYLLPGTGECTMLAGYAGLFAFLPEALKAGGGLR